MNCPACRSTKLIRKRIEYKLLGEKIGIFMADYCATCKDHFFSKEASLTIEKIAKEKGIWELSSKGKITKVGNSYAIFLNKKIADYLEIEQGEEVIVYPESKNKIILGRTKLIA